MLHTRQTRRFSKDPETATSTRCTQIIINHKRPISALNVVKVFIRGTHIKNFGNDATIYSTTDETLKHFIVFNHRPIGPSTTINHSI